MVGFDLKHCMVLQLLQRGHKQKAWPKSIEGFEYFIYALRTSFTPEILFLSRTLQDVLMVLYLPWNGVSLEIIWPGAKGHAWYLP